MCFTCFKKQPKKNSIYCFGGFGGAGWCSSSCFIRTGQHFFIKEKHWQLLMVDKMFLFQSWQEYSEFLWKHFHCGPVTPHKKPQTAPSTWLAPQSGLSDDRFVPSLKAFRCFLHGTPNRLWLYQMDTKSQQHFHMDKRMNVNWGQITARVSKEPKHLQKSLLNTIDAFVNLEILHAILLWWVFKMHFAALCPPACI